MTLLKTVVIDQAKVKTKWQEPYVSSAINRELSAIPCGVYRGFVIAQKTTIGKGILVTHGTDEDSLLLYENRDESYKLAVRYENEFNIDFDFDASASS